MRKHKHYYITIALTGLLFTGFTIGSIAQETNTIVNPKTEVPVILSTNPANSEENVDLKSVIEITFSSEMDETTMNGTTLMLHATYSDSMHEDQGEMGYDQIRERSAIKNEDNGWQNTTGAVYGTISYSNKVAVFTPDSDLKEGTHYTFTVTKGVTSLENIALEDNYIWSFTSSGTVDSTFTDRQNDRYGYDHEEIEDKSIISMVNEKTDFIELGKAGNFVILAKENVSNESGSDITGNIGEGSVESNLKAEKDHSDSAQRTVTGQAAMQSNLSDTTSPDVNEALEDMMSAYRDASSQNGDDLTRHGNENFQSREFAPGVHEWDDSLHIDSDVTLSGSAEDVWLFKVSDNLIIDENIVFTLANGARADNIFWLVEGEVTIGEKAKFEGIILSMNEITLEKGANLNGRMFSQTSINLDENTVTEPVSLNGRTTSTNR
jgi:hypothetical protein